MTNATPRTNLKKEILDGKTYFIQIIDLIKRIFLPTLPLFKVHEIYFYFLKTKYRGKIDIM